MDSETSVRSLTNVATHVIITLNMWPTSVTRI